MTSELVDAIAKYIRERFSHVTLHGLSGRSDLNGLAADVIGPLDEKSGRVPVCVRSTNESIKARPKNVFESGLDQLPHVLELGAGNGVLAYCLTSALHGYARVIAVDDLSESMPRLFGEDVERLDSEEAVATYEPDLVLCSWMPAGVDWTAACRRCKSVQAYLLLGDPSSCGDGARTWDQPPEADFERVELPDVSQWLLCRVDSAAARGFSRAVEFGRRRDADRDNA